MEFNFENVVKKLGEINKAIYGVNPFGVSLKKEPNVPLRFHPCPKCDSTGKIAVPNGPDDFDYEECPDCTL